MSEEKFRVIVADDEKLIAKSIARNIEKANAAFEVVRIAYNGAETYALVAELLPHVVFSDIKMPEMDGLELIERISREYPTVKTVIVSGYNDFDMARSALQNNAVDYILKPINPFILQKTLNKLECELLAEKKQLTVNRENFPADIVESIVTYIAHNYGDQITFTEIAKQYGFSSAYLCKIFKEHTGTPAGRYLNEYRINVSKRMLLDTDLSIKDIAEKVGFCDQFHFSKNFRNIVGMSPTQFRSKESFLNGYSTLQN